MKRATCLTLALLLLLLGCSSKERPQGPLRYDLERAPSTLDPQFAESDSSLLVVANVFEGLTRLSPSGVVEPACAERWEASQGGLVYTFWLKEGLKWSDGSALTADDFVFAFERMFEPLAPSPSAELFLGIVGAKERLAGQAATLGVFALDAHTLRFELTSGDPSLPARLAQSGAMPCSRAFFSEQKGRYGLTGESILCNGPFAVTNWSATQLSLRANQHYAKPVGLSGVNLYVSRGDPTALFIEGRSDLCVIPYHRLAEAGAVEGSTFFDQTWTLLANLKGEVGGDWGLRAALLSALGEDFAANRLSGGLSEAQGLIPPSALFGGGSYRDRAGATAPATPVADARGLFLSSLERLELDKLPRVTLLVADFAPNPELGGAMQRIWQQSLSAHVNMEQLPYAELNARVMRGDYDFALLPLPSQGNRPEEYLSLFTGTALAALQPLVTPPKETPAAAQGAQQGGLSQEEMRLGELIEQAQGLADYAEAAPAFLAVEQRLIDGWAALPIYDAPSFFAQRAGIKGAVYTAASRAVYFADVVYVP